MGRRSVVGEHVLDVMRAGEQHCWTLDDLQAALASGVAPPNPSSVFRAVIRLEEAGEVIRVPMDERRASFEVAGRHHDHLICEGCGAVEAVACAVLEQLSAHLRDSAGFVVSGHQLVLTGTCRACRETVTEPGRGAS